MLIKVTLYLSYLISRDAIFIVGSIDPYKTKNKFHLNYHRLNKRKNRKPGELKLRLRYDGYYTDWFDYLFVSQKEMKEIVNGTGWLVKSFFSARRAPFYAAVLKKIQSRPSVKTDKQISFALI